MNLSSISKKMNWPYSNPGQDVYAYKTKFVDFPDKFHVLAFVETDS